MLRHHPFWWHLVPHHQLTQFYISFALRSFALSLIMLFIPLYLYHEIGYTLTETLLFFAFYSFVFALFCPIAAKFCSRFGVKHSVLLSMPFFLAYLGVLYLLPYVKVPLVIPGILVGISLAFYWVGAHSLFHRISHHNHRGEEVGKQIIMKVLGETTGPVIGGLLIHLVGFKFVFLLVAVSLFTAAGVLFLSKENHERYHFSLRSIINKEHWYNSLYFISRGTEVIATMVVWPLFIFFILGDYFSLGIVGSILAGGSALLIWFVGRYSDHINKRKIVLWVSGFESLSWFLRSMVTTPFQVFTVTILGAITNGLWLAPLGALEYDKATKSDVMGYFVSREVFINVGRILMVFIIILTNNLAGGLIFQGFANLAALLF